MDKLLVVYAHLIATCLALGVIITTDLRLIAKLMSYRCVIRPPRRFETNVITLALIGLCCSGIALVMMGLDADPNYLADNPKLVAKMLLVGLLCLNAFVLHRITFPRLMQPHTVSAWTRRDHLAVALPVALSNTLWLYCAFLGVARIWNNHKPLIEVLLPAAGLFVLLALAILAGLRLAARDEPLTPPDWIDSMKARLSDHAPLDGLRRPAFEDSRDSLLP
ncbi:hypothetical protein ACVNIS_00765 [Sphaerotilaceae bacterium SBD11-9]